MNETATNHPSAALKPALLHAADGVGAKQRRRRSYARVAFAGFVACPLFAWLAYVAAVAWWPYPDDIAGTPPSATFLLDRHGKPLAAFAASDGQWRLPLTGDEISPHLLRAIVAVEDARFLDHAGVDWKSAVGTAWQNAAAFHVKRGASTLTMQLHRLRDPRSRSFWAKIEQTIRAKQIERTTSKHAILVEYLNRAPFGGNVVGAGAASWRYLGKPCASLSLAEAALLAGLPKNPNQYRPDRFSQRAVARRNEVLDRMLATGAITRAQYDQATAEPMRASLQPLPQATDRASGALPALLQMPHGRVVSTTIDAGIQRQVYVATRDALERLRPSGITAASAVVLDTRTADCLATVSLSNASGAVDLASQPRSTGSVLKPFIYAAAFEAGTCAPASSLDDSPAAWAGYSPEDFDHTFRGQISAADALADSRNLPAMQVLSKTGVAYVRGVLESAGLETLASSGRPVGLTLAVGGAEASVMEVATAYAGLARGGTVAQASLSPQSGEGQGEGLQESRLGQAAPSLDNLAPRRTSHGGVKDARFLTSRACWQVLRVLSDPDRTRSLSRSAARLNAAWKTGTSSNHRDAWCAAVTSGRTVVVWFGNADGRPAAALVGRDAAAPLALDLIASLDEGSAPADWPDEAPEPAHASMASYTLNDRPRLAVVSPVADRDILLSDDLPAERQRVQLRASGAAGALQWFIDAAPQTSDWWTPTPGTHEVRVVTAAGDASIVRVNVRSR